METERDCVPAQDGASAADVASESAVSPCEVHLQEEAKEEFVPGDGSDVIGFTAVEVSIERPPLESDVDPRPATLVGSVTEEPVCLQEALPNDACTTLIGVGAATPLAALKECIEYCSTGIADNPQVNIPSESAGVPYPAGSGENSSTQVDSAGVHALVAGARGETLPQNCDAVEEAVEKAFAGVSLVSARVDLAAEPTLALHDQEENMANAPERFVSITSPGEAMEHSQGAHEEAVAHSSCVHGQSVEHNSETASGCVEATVALPVCTLKETATLPSDQLSEVRKASAGLFLIGQIESSDSTSSDSDTSSSSSSESDTPHCAAPNSGALRADSPVCEMDLTSAVAAGESEDTPGINTCVPFPENGKLLSIGKVCSHLEGLVIISSLPGTPPVDAGTVLWNSEKQSLACIYETFGLVKSPYYSVKVKTSENIETLGLPLGALVYVVPASLELTKYVFTSQLMREKGTDASWKDDFEVPGGLQEFSDDEAELKARKPARRSASQSSAAQHYRNPQQDHSAKPSTTPAAVCNYQHAYQYPTAYEGSMPQPNPWSSWQWNMQ